MVEALTLIVLFGFIVGVVYFLVWWSYQARADRAATVGLYIILGVPGFLLLVAGVAASFRGSLTPWGVTLSLTALGFLLPIAPGFRRSMARLGGFSPTDPLHMTGLGLFLALIGYLGSQNVLLPAPDDIAEVDIPSIVIQGVFFVALALACIGFGIGRGWREARVRLGLVPVSSKGLLAVLGVVLAGFVVAVVSSVIQTAIDPDTSAVIDQNLEAITGGNPTLIMAPLIGLSAGIGEELVMRGVLQPRYGIVLTSLLFTALHGQYGFSFVLVGLFALSLMLGWVARRYGTTHAILAHTLYNVISVLLSAL